MKNKEEKGLLKQKINTFLILYFKWIVVFFVIIIFVIAYFLIIKEEYERMKELDQSIEEQEQNFLAKKTEIRQIKNLVTLYEEVTPEDMEKMLAILPEEEMLEKLFPYLESMVINNGLLINSINISSDIKSSAETTVSAIETVDAQTESSTDNNDDFPDNIGKVKVSMEVSGIDYSNFKNILTVIENNLRLMDLSRVDFNPESDSTTFEFDTYYFKE